MENQITKPSFVTEKHLNFLDNLRESGVTNMFGAAPYVKRKFKVSDEQARQILVYWMKTFSNRHPEGR